MTDMEVPIMDANERNRAISILQKEFGPKWNQIVQELGTETLGKN